MLFQNFLSNQLKSSRTKTRPLNNGLLPNKINKPCTFNYIAQLFVFINFAMSTTLLHAQKVLENHLVGSPKIQCEESRIRVSIRTNEAFGGNVYAKGFFNKDICRVRGNNVGNSANITIPVSADCGMRRRRLAEPKGLVLEMTIVLMFHSKFLTRNDKAYHIECLYQEISQKVTSHLDISSLPSTELSESANQLGEGFTLPSCKYEVRI